MKRRDFLVGLTSVAVLSAAGTYFYTNRDIDYNPEIAEPFFLLHIWDHETIDDIGKKYLADALDEKDDQDLAKQILKKNDSQAPESIERINEQIAEDFKNDQTVLVDGWILSVTEARQCGLYSLIQES